MKKIIIAVVLLAVILGALFYFFGARFLQEQEPEEQVTLELWGLWEDDSLIRPVMNEYKKIKPEIVINYNHQSSVNYRTRVQTQVSTREDPDIFLIHNSWLPMFLRNNQLSSMPIDLMTYQEFSQTFYPVAAESLTSNNQIYALPLEIDGLALFYNEDLLSAKNITVPKTWQEFVEAATALTEQDQSGNIIVAGAAMGATGNVDHWQDILGLLFLQQPNANLEVPANSAGAEVLKFYTNFMLDPRRKTWDLNMESSTQAFYSGRLAFYFAPSWRAHDLRVANPKLNFKTAPVPKLPNKVVNWASFWGFAVSSRSNNQKESWEFLKFLTSKTSEKLLYQEASKVRLFGQPYSRVDLQSELLSDPIVGSFVSQGATYKHWYLASRTFDQGLNDEMIKYFEDAINATAQGADPLGALRTTQSGVNQVLTKYVLPPAPISE